MISNTNTVLTVKTANSYQFEESCNYFVSKGFNIASSGHNGTEWWAVLVKPQSVKRNRANKEGVSNDD